MNSGIGIGTVESCGKTFFTNRPKAELAWPFDVSVHSHYCTDTLTLLEDGTVEGDVGLFEYTLKRCANGGFATAVFWLILAEAKRQQREKDTNA